MHGESHEKGIAPPSGLFAKYLVPTATETFYHRFNSIAIVPLVLFPFLTLFLLSTLFIIFVVKLELGLLTIAPPS